jgi:hypothetical protein
VKIETATLQYGAPVRVVVADDAATTRRPVPGKMRPPRGPLAWAAGLARAALGLKQDEPEEHQEIEIR